MTESFSFPRRFIYLCEIAFSGPYRCNFRKVRAFGYFIAPLLCIVSSRAAFFAAQTLDFAVKFRFVFRRYVLALLSVGRFAKV